MEYNPLTDNSYLMDNNNSENEYLTINQNNDNNEDQIKIEK